MKHIYVHIQLDWDCVSAQAQCVCVSKEWTYMVWSHTLMMSVKIPSKGELSPANVNGLQETNNGSRHDGVSLQASKCVSVDIIIIQHIYM